VVVILGSQGMIFASKRTYHVAFPDVGGLREGAVVRLGGYQVGEVSEISFAPEDGGHTRLVVTLRVRDKHAERVRLGALARISSQGLLGDKLIELTLGPMALPPVPDGGWIVGEPPGDPNRLIASATAAAEHARNILAKLDDATGKVDAQSMLNELEETMSTVRRVATRIETGPGTAHELIYDNQLAAGARQTLGALGRAADEGEKLVAGIRQSSDQIAAVTAAVDPAKVKQVTDDLAAVVADVRAGRGTLGGLLVDPTLYEETKRILVNIRRNRVLSALARMVISDEIPAEVMDARPAKPLTPTTPVRPRPAPGLEAAHSTPEGPVRRP
jgi:phospholipid/cholesterol/gamma-HCH transport system substrate-binding protein